MTENFHDTFDDLRDRFIMLIRLSDDERKMKDVVDFIVTMASNVIKEMSGHSKDEQGTIVIDSINKYVGFHPGEVDIIKETIKH